ncbi:MAG: DUF2922 domain-containing protein [Synergistaceae bacterium]|nr:DUF2922 domain-containing protein [Synergistaceae bacterium]
MKTLRMQFALNDGKEKTVSFNYVRENVTSGEVENAMDVILAQSVLPNVVGLAGADIVDRTITPLF